jgi:molybdate transport system substrate-binding protein
LSAVKLKVMSAGAVEGPVRALTPEFMRDTGHDVALDFNTVGALKDRFSGGEATDVIILSAPAIEALQKDGRLAAGSRTDLGRASCGVAVRDGMLMPDISTPEAFQRALVNAQTIGANDPAHGGSSGIYLAALLDRLGMAETLKPKMVLGKTGREVAILVATGKAELGITFTSEFIAVEGTRVVGPLPKGLEYVNGYAGALPQQRASGGASEAASAYLSFLASAPSKATFKRFGLE